jgi:outer membrane protein
MKSIIILVILLNINFFPLFAQQKWSLEDCIAYAMNNNMDIKSQTLNIASNKILVDKSKLNYMPNLDFNTNYQLSIGRSLDPTTYSFIEDKKINTFNTGINFGTTIFDGQKRYYTYRKSLSELDVSKANYETLKNDIAISVTIGYMNILLNKEVINSIKKQIAISEINITKAQRLYEEGVITDDKLQNIMIQRDNELFSLADSEGNLKIAIINLCSLLHLSDYDTFDVIEDASLMADDAIPLFDVIASVRFLPQTESAKIKSKSAEYSLKIARSDLYPTLSLGAAFASSFSDARQKPLMDELGNPIISGDGFLFGNYPFFNQLNDNRNSYIAFTLNMPIFNIFQTNKNISLAKNNMRQAQYEAENTEKKLIAHIHEIYAEIETAKKKYAVAVSLLERGKIVASHAENKFANGTLTVSDYIIEKENILIAEAQASKAKYEYLLKLYLLKFYYKKDEKK